ncbi:hypothetical protein CHCC20335_0128 [Bacillus paralicheniformis]|nr:hypothetical protein CHCC20335_0128 [Bacillus paralicheniformis]
MLKIYQSHHLLSCSILRGPIILMKKSLSAHMSRKAFEKLGLSLIFQSIRFA